MSKDIRLKRAAPKRHDRLGLLGLLGLFTPNASLMTKGKRRTKDSKAKMNRAEAVGAVKFHQHAEKCGIPQRGHAPCAEHFRRVMALLGHWHPRPTDVPTRPLCGGTECKTTKCRKGRAARKLAEAHVLAANAGGASFRPTFN